MSDTAIRVEHLSKSYLIGHERSGPSYRTFRETLVHGIGDFGKKMLDTARGRQIVEGNVTEEFWALKDVSFDVRRGEVLGIIGRNGAGKSTLLKVLSRITEPTEGRATIRGRVASLLEVGTGFHAELTGRENIFLNGAVLGMTRAEVKRKFDEIVDFAGVEKFLDTPMKRYSSGMYVRLAFAVAAHLEPEILVIDEVLAVGDVEFQKKCLGKMQDVAGHGRTVLFVSHNMAAVKALCNSVIVLSKGRKIFDGDVRDGVQTYLDHASVSDAPLLPAGNDYLSIHECRVHGDDAGEAPVLNSTEALTVDVTIDQKVNLPGSRYVFTFLRPDETVAFSVTDHAYRGGGNTAAGRYRVRLRVPPYVFNYGAYRLDICCDTPGAFLFLNHTPIARLEFAGETRHGSSFPEAWPGAMLPKCDVDVSHVGRQSSQAVETNRISER